MRIPDDSKTFVSQLQLRVDDELRQSCRIVTILAAILFPLFFVLDIYTEPNHLKALGIIRLLTTVVYGLSFLLSRTNYIQRRPFLWALIVVGTATISITSMCLVLSGYESHYYAGINLVILATGLFFPLKTKPMTLTLSLIFGIYFLSVLIEANFHFEHPEYLINNISFILATSVICIAKANYSFMFRQESFKVALQVESAQSRLDESKDFLDSLIENLPNMIFVKEAKSLCFVRFNKAGEELLGYSREELLGKNDYDFFPADQAEAFVAKDRAVLAGKITADIPEEKIKTRQNGIRILHTKKIPVTNSKGEPLYLLGISEDITELKMALAKRVQFMDTVTASLASSTLDYHKALESVARLMVPELCDWCTMTILKDNINLERVFAFHKDPAKEKLIAKLLSISAKDVAKSKTFKDVLSTGKTWHLAYATEESLRLEAANDEHFKVIKGLGARHYINVAIRSRDDIIGCMALFIGDDKRIFSQEDRLFIEELGRRTGIAIENALLYEKAKNAVAARDNFLSVASHELKTPLTSLGLQIRMAQKEGKALPVLTKTLGLAAKQVSRLAKLVDDLLDVTRIGAGKLLYHLERVDLTSLVQETLGRHQEQFKESGSPVEFKGDKPVIVECDPYRIEQVISNLLTNAVKYGSGTPVTVAVSEISGKAIIRVADKGIGIPEHQRVEIFDRFERASAPKGTSGLGLGLYISKEIVKNHGGQIKVEENLPSGSTFTVALPMPSVVSTL